MKAKLLIAILILLTVPSFAQEGVPSSASLDSSAETSEAQLLFDPRALDAGTSNDTGTDTGTNNVRNISYYELLANSLEMEEPLYILEKRFAVVIPKSVPNLQKYPELRSMTNRERGLFANKKNALLNSFARFLQFFRMSPTNINYTLERINEQMFQSAKLIADSNGTRFTTVGALSFGFGVPTQLLQWLKKLPALQRIPENIGIYWFASLGFTIVRAKYNGQIHWSFEPIAQFRRGTKILLPFAFIGLGLPTGIGFVRAEKNSPSYEKLDMLRLSVLTFLRNSNNFFVNIPIGGALGTALTAGVLGEAYQFAINRDGLMKIQKSLRFIFKKKESELEVEVVQEIRNCQNIFL